MERAPCAAAGFLLITDTKTISFYSALFLFDAIVDIFEMRSLNNNNGTSFSIEMHFFDVEKSVNHQFHQVLCRS